MAEGAFSPETRLLIVERAGGFCEYCTLPLRYGGQVHHRRPRGMGGSSSPMVEHPSNGVWVHPACHARIESHRDESYRDGWLVRSGFDPASVPVKRNGRWVFLTGDGVVPAELPGWHVLNQERDR